MADIVARLRAYAADDHERGCQGREYTCACGYDDKRDPLLAEAADTITALRADNARLRAALAESADELDAYYRMEYPGDHPYNKAKLAQALASNPARAALKETSDG